MALDRETNAATNLKAAIARLIAKAESTTRRPPRDMRALRMLVARGIEGNDEPAPQLLDAFQGGAARQVDAPGRGAEAAGDPIASRQPLVLGQLVGLGHHR